MGTKKVRCTVCDGSGVVTRIHKTETSCGIARVTCYRCHGTGKKEVPVTNADRIRAMSDEELAILIVKHHPMHAWNKQVREIYFGFEDHRKNNPQRAWIEWLKQPVEEERR